MEFLQRPNSPPNQKNWGVNFVAIDVRCYVMRDALQGVMTLGVIGLSSYTSVVVMRVNGDIFG